MEDGRNKVKIDVIYEDNHIIVANKPFSIPTQEDESKDMDMLRIIKGYIKEKYNKPGDVFIGLLHRLDRVSGGVMVFARTSKAASRLSEQIRKKKVSKTYLTVVEGILESKEGKMIDYLLKDKEKNKVKSVDSQTKNSKEAILQYKVLDEKDNMSLVEVNLITGRSHQIRVQFSSRGFPILGDMKYGSKNPREKSIALWSNSLSFEHPTLKETMKFESNPPKEYPWNLF